eukprot:10395761-Alexandrium_andersonii.AAC.1
MLKVVRLKGKDVAQTPADVYAYCSETQHWSNNRLPERSDGAQAGGMEGSRAWWCFVHFFSHLVLGKSRTIR